MRRHSSEVVTFVFSIEVSIRVLVPLGLDTHPVPCFVDILLEVMVLFRFDILNSFDQLLQVRLVSSDFIRNAQEVVLLGIVHLLLAALTGYLVVRLPTLDVMERVLMHLLDVGYLEPLLLSSEVDVVVLRSVDVYRVLIDGE